MKTNPFRLLAAVIAPLILIASSVNAEEDGKHLFILSGQSNMARLNPKLSFTPTVEAAFGKDNVIVVKSAKGSQTIRKWYKKWKPSKGDAPKGNGTLYDGLMDGVNRAIKGKKIKTVTSTHVDEVHSSGQGFGSTFHQLR